MRLWTLQTRNHDLTSGQVDHTQSDYWDKVPRLPDSYKKLWRRLNTPEGQKGQIIWLQSAIRALPILT